VGTFPYNMAADIKKALLTPTSMMFIGLILFCGLLLFFILVRAISVPLKDLTDIVDRISLGELDLSVRPRGPREIRNLAQDGGRLSDEDQAGKVLNAVLDSGVNFIDTSWCYGRSEELIGRYISHRRDDYFLATKCGH